jgi:ribonuclease III
MNHPDLLTLAECLHHQFAEPNLLLAAVTHPSRLGLRRNSQEKTYQRLEFLGDRVLGLVIADMLWMHFPDESEGDLAKRHAGLVREETLAEVAQEIELGRFLLLSSGESDSGGRRNPTILADVCEAIIGALFRDGGLAAAGAFIERHWASRIDSRSRPPREAKTALQEWAQARGLPLPTYLVVGRDGPPHNPSFVVEVEVQGFPPERAEGPNKRLAEKSAATALLACLEANDRRAQA